MVEYEIFQRKIIVGMECIVKQMQIASEKIHFLKFILEGYDGLAIQSTLDVSSGLVVLRYPPEVEQDVRALLDDLKKHM